MTNTYGIYPQANQMNSYYPQRNTNYSVQNNSIIWVQGIEGAKAYQLAPNTIIQLMDSENDGIFYIKVSDNIGMSTLRIFKYSEIEAAPKNVATEQPDLSAYVRKDELQDLITGLIVKNEQEESHEQAIPTAQSTKQCKPTITK